MPDALDRGLVNVRPRLRVVVADDQWDVRSLLRIVLEAGGDLQVVGEAEDGAAAVRLAQELRPGAVVSDLVMPRMRGDEALSILHRELPRSLLVLCSAQPTREAVEAAHADAVVEKRDADWPFQIAQVLIEAAGRLGPPTWPEWERRGVPR